MRDIHFFAKLLGLNKPWTVSQVSLSPEEKRIDVGLEHGRRAEFSCPECHLPLPLYDHIPARQWRHLDPAGISRGCTHAFRVFVRSFVFGT